MKQIFKISGITIGCAIFISVLAISIWYINYIPSGEDYDDDIELLEGPFGGHMPPEFINDGLPKLASGFNINKYFDLFVADEIFKDKKNKKWEPFTNERTQVKWDIPVEQFWNNDTITFSFTNTTGNKLYYLGYTHSSYCFVFLDYIISTQGKIDTLYCHEGGFEGAEGTEYIPFKKGKSITLKDDNPFLQDPYYGFTFLSRPYEDFPKIIKEVYGDTAQIRYFVFLRGMPWNNRGFSIAYSDFITIPIDSIISGWEKGKFEHRRIFIPEGHQGIFEW